MLFLAEEYLRVILNLSEKKSTYYYCETVHRVLLIVLGRNIDMVGLPAVGMEQKFIPPSTLRSNEGLIEVLTLCQLL